MDCALVSLIRVTCQIYKSRRNVPTIFAKMKFSETDHIWNCSVVLVALPVCINNFFNCLMVWWLKLWQLLQLQVILEHATISILASAQYPYYWSLCRLARSAILITAKGCRTCDNTSSVRLLQRSSTPVPDKNALGGSRVEDVQGGPINFGNLGPD